MNKPMVIDPYKNADDNPDALTEAEVKADVQHGLMVDAIVRNMQRGNDKQNNDVPVRAGN